MELAGILLAVCVLVLSTPSASTQSGQLVLHYGYPVNNTNFSYIALICIYEDPESNTFIEGADYQLNGTDIEEELNVTNGEDGTLRFILTTEKEGFFTCSLNGSLSNNSIGFAAQPSTNYSGQSRVHNMELPDDDSVVSTELQCDIQPGALRQRYSVQWKQILNESSYIIANEGMFNLTLNVSSSLNGSQYQCEVTIDHDGTIVRSYGSVLTTIVTALVTKPPKPTEPESTLSFGIIIVITAAVLIAVVVLIGCVSSLGFYIHDYKGRNKVHSLLADVPRNRHNKDSRPTPNCGNMTEEFETMSIDSVDTAILLDNPASPTENVSPVLQTNTTDHDSSYFNRPNQCCPVHEEQVNVEPLQTSALEIQLCHVTASETDQCTRDNELHPVTSIEGEDHQNIAGRNSGEIFQATPRPENPFLPRYSADPHNTAEHIPKWMKPVGTLTDCTSDGRSYYDKHSDFRLEIPEGAIPEGERIIVDIGVALYGPYQYPKGLRSVSPVFWVCVRGRETFRFLKPVKIMIEHCLRLDSDTDTHSLGLTFLKGDHSESTNQKYLLQRLQEDEECEFIANDNHAVLHTNHFCYQCIARNISKEFIYSANFAFLVFTPKDMVYSKPVPIFFFVIFLLEACIKTIEEQMEKRKEGEIFYSTTLAFRFPKGKDNPVIKLQWEKTLPGGWSIESRNVIEIAYNDIDFYGVDPEHLKTWEMCGLYPPRFTLSIDGSHTTLKAVAKFTFSGALTHTSDDNLKYTMQLLPQFPQPTRKGAGLGSPQLMTPPISPPNSPITSELGIMDLFEVLFVVESLAGRWNRLGLALGLYQPELAKIKVENPDTEQCLQEVLTIWLNQMYDVQKFGEPSWAVLVKAIASTAGGRNPALALHIAQKYNIPFFAA